MKQRPVEGKRLAAPFRTTDQKQKLAIKLRLLNPVLVAADGQRGSRSGQEGQSIYFRNRLKS